MRMRGGEDAALDSYIGELWHKRLANSSWHSETQRLKANHKQSPGSDALWLWELTKQL